MQRMDEMDRDTKSIPKELRSLVSYPGHPLLRKYHHLFPHPSINFCIIGLMQAVQTFGKKVLHIFCLFWLFFRKPPQLSPAAKPAREWSVSTVFLLNSFNLRLCAWRLLSPLWFSERSALPTWISASVSPVVVTLPRSMVCPYSTLLMLC